MELKVTTKINFGEQFGNQNSFQNSYLGTSEEDWKQECSCNETEDLVDEPFKISNVNRFTYELKHGNNFDVCVQGGLIQPDEELCSLHIFCNENDEFKRPVKFDLILDDSNLMLAQCSNFTLGNCQNLQSNIRISNVRVNPNKKANLVIIVATK